MTSQGKDHGRDFRTVLGTHLYRWKFKVLDDNINKLKLNFPLTDDMLNELQTTMKERYVTAVSSFDLPHLKVNPNSQLMSCFVATSTPF